MTLPTAIALLYLTLTLLGACAVRLHMAMRYAAYLDRQY